MLHVPQKYFLDSSVMDAGWNFCRGKGCRTKAGDDNCHSAILPDGGFEGALWARSVHLQTDEQSPHDVYLR